MNERRTWAFSGQHGQLQHLSSDKIASAAAINDVGQIVGDMAVPGDTTGTNRRAVLWDGDKVIDLGTLGGETSSATGINNKGQIVGNSDLKGQQNHAFLWQAGKMTDLGALRGTGCEATAINDKGEIIGNAQNLRGRVIAILWQNGKIIKLGTLSGDCRAAALNNQAQVVGQFDVLTHDPFTSEQHGFVYSGGKMYDLNKLIPKQPEYLIKDAVAINDKGQIAANGGVNGLTHALLLTPIAP